MTESISNIIALIVAIISAGTTIYNVFFKDEYGRKQKYYNCLLQPFVMAYKKNKEISATAFVISKATREDDSVPKYVFYLIDKSQAQSKDISAQPDSQNPPIDNDECLKKVLIEDYISLYPNSHNKTRRVFEIAFILLHYVMIIFMFVLMFVGSLLIVSGVLSLIAYPFSDIIEITRIGDWEFNAWQWSLVKLFIGGVIPFVGALLVRYIEQVSDDMYTTKEKRVKRLIKKRIQCYKKNQNEYVL